MNKAIAQIGKAEYLAMEIVTSGVSQKDMARFLFEVITNLEPSIFPDEDTQESRQKSLDFYTDLIALLISYRNDFED